MPLLLDPRIYGDKNASLQERLERFKQLYPEQWEKVVAPAITPVMDKLVQEQAPPQEQQQEPGYIESAVKGLAKGLYHAYGSLAEDVGTLVPPLKPLTERMAKSYEAAAQSLELPETKSAAKNFLNRLSQSAGYMLEKIPEALAIGSTVKAATASTRIAKWLGDMSDFVVGSMAQGAVKGAREEGVPGAVKGAVEQGVYARLYEGPSMKLQPEAAMKRALRPVYKKIAADAARFTGVGVGQTVYEAAKQGRAPTEDELKQSIADSLGMFAAFQIMPVISKLSGKGKEKLEIARVRKKLNEAIKKGNVEQVKAALDDFFENPKVSDDTKEKVAVTVEKAKQAAVEPEPEEARPDEQLQQMAEKRGIDLAQWEAERQAQPSTWVEEKAAYPERQVTRVKPVYEQPIKPQFVPRETIAKAEQEAEQVAKFGRLPRGEVINVSPVAPEREEPRLITPRETFLERAKRRVGGKPGVEEKVQPAVPEEPTIWTPRTMGAREVIRFAEQEREAGPIHEGMTKPEVQEVPGKEGQGMPTGRGVQGIRRGGQEAETIEEVTTKSGKPFKTKGALVLQLRKRGLLDTHEPVKVDEGWIGKPKEAIQPESPKAEPEKPEAKQTEIRQKGLRQGRRIGGKMIIGVGQSELKTGKYTGPTIERDGDLFVIRPNDANFEPQWFKTYEEAQEALKKIESKQLEKPEPKQADEIKQLFVQGAFTGIRKPTEKEEAAKLVKKAREIREKSQVEAIELLSKLSRQDLEKMDVDALDSLLADATMGPGNFVNMNWKKPDFIEALLKVKREASKPKRAVEPKQAEAKQPYEMTKEEFENRIKQEQKKEDEYEKKFFDKAFNYIFKQTGIPIDKLKDEYIKRDGHTPLTFIQDVVNKAHKNFLSKKDKEKLHEIYDEWEKNYLNNIESYWVNDHQDLIDSGEGHKDLIRQALKERELTPDQYNKTHAKDYGEYGSEEFKRNFPGVEVKPKQAIEAISKEKPVKPAESAEISIPPFRDFRVKQASVNSAVLYPNRIGAKFSDEHIAVLKDWAKQNGLYVSEASPTKIKVIRTDLKPLDLSMHGAKGVKAEIYKEKKQAVEKAREEKRKQLEENFYKRPSAKWIEDVFGKDFANAFNKNALADFLEGKVKKPTFVLTWRWKDGLDKLNALDKQGKIDWEKVKQAYKEGTLKEKGKQQAITSEQNVYTIPSPVNKKAFLKVIDEAIAKAPKGKDIKEEEVTFSKPATYEGIKRIEVRYAPFDIKLLLEKSPSEDGWRVLEETIDKKGITHTERLTKAPLVLQEARKFAIAYIKGEAQSKGQVVFKGPRSEYKIRNSKYALEKFRENVKKSKGIKQYSLGERPEKPLTKPLVDLMVKKASAKWKETPGITVVEKQSDLPKEVQRPEPIKGVYYKDKVYLVAENLASHKDVVKTLAEEVIGHAGLRKALDSKLYDQTLDTLWNKHKDDILPIAKDYKLDVTKPEQRRQAVDEWIAKQIADDSLPKRIWQRLVFAVKAFARKLGYSGNLTLNEIKGMLRAGVINGYNRRINEFAVSPRYSLKEAIKKITDNPNFRKWFGKSKVVDKNGEPLVVYHGTDEEFNVFDKEKLGWNTFGNADDPAWAATAGVGFWFNSGEIRESKYFPGKRFMPVYLKIENPYYFDSIDELADSLRKYVGDASSGDYEKILLGAKKWVASAKADRYDGVVVNDEEFGGKSYVVFSENQIKSIYNRGTFDPNNPDIRYSLGKAADTEQLKEAAEVIKEAEKEPKAPEPIKPFVEKVKDSKAKEFLAKTKNALLEAFAPELLHEKGKEAEAKASELVAKELHAVNVIKNALYERKLWWDKLPESARLKYIISFEEGDNKALMELAGGNKKVYETLQAIKTEHRDLYNKIYEAEKKAGIELNYIKDYWVHLWKDPDKAARVFRQFRETMGKDPFTRSRILDTIRQGLELGLELKTTNPEEMVIARINSGVRAIVRQKFMDWLVENGLAEPYKKGTKLTKEFDTIVKMPDGKAYMVNKARAEKLEKMSDAGKRVYLKNLIKNGYIKPYKKGTDLAGKKVIDAPNGKAYAVVKEIVPLMENAGLKLEGPKSLWVKDTPAGMSYRTLMRAKNMFIPIKLGMSLFHATHIGTIMMPAVRAGIILDALEGGRSWGEAIKDLAKVSTGLTQIKEVKEGLRLGKLLDKPLSELSPADRQAVEYILEGGFTTQMPHEWKVEAKEAFDKALASKNVAGILGHGVRRVVELSGSWLFEYYIPALKRVAYLKRVRDLMARRPELADKPNERLKEFTKIRKSIDNQFGEMTYKTLFWKPILKDVGIGSMLSMGWQLGFVREYGGAAVDTARFFKELAKKVAKKEGKPEITGRMVFVLDYTIQSLLLGGLLTWALTGSMPQKLIDYIYPRTGDQEPDGTPTRLNTPYYTREFGAIAQHIKTEGPVTGMLHMFRNKANPMIAPILRLWTNKDFYGTDIRDPHAPILTQTKQFFEYLAGEAAPISLSSAKRGAETMGWAKSLLLSEIGFTKAPAYARLTPLQSKIFKYYSEYKDKRMTRDEAERSRIKRKMRVEWLTTGKISDETWKEAFDKDVFLAAKPSQVKANITTFIKSLRLSSDVRSFAGLPADIQVALLKEMNEQELKKFLPHAKGIAKIRYYRFKQKKGGKE